MQAPGLEQAKVEYTVDTTIGSRKKLVLKLSTQ